MSALIYGAYGYTGRLITQEAVGRGHAPVLAGRDPEPLSALGADTDLPTRTVGLSQSRRLRAVIDDVDLVLHCAGPYVRTAEPMVEACLETGTHYVDLTGEIDVFEWMGDQAAEAEARGVMLLPGGGFDVVASDCMARYVTNEVPSATTLEIAIYHQGGVSRGTLQTLIEQMGQPGRVRREGQLVKVPPGWTTRTVDFGDESRSVLSIPEGSVYSTNVPNVTAYLALPRWIHPVVRASRYVRPILQWEPLQALLRRLVQQTVVGPSAETRRRGRTVLWAAARRGTEPPVTARLHCPDAYTFTARAAVDALERVLDGTAPGGVQTPSTAFGADFVLDVEGVRREIVKPK